MAELEAVFSLLVENAVLLGVIASLLTIAGAIIGVLSLFKQVRQRLWLVLVWCGKQVWHGFWFLLTLPKHLPGLVRRAASGCRRLWGKVQAMRRERLKRRVIEKLRCYEARGELPAEQVAALVQAIALL